MVAHAARVRQQRGDLINAGRKAVANSKLFNPDKGPDALNKVLDLTVEIIGAVKKSIGDSKLSDAQMTAIAIRLYAMGAIYGLANDLIKPKIYDVNPGYYNENIKRIDRHYSGGGGATVDVEF